MELELSAPERSFTRCGVCGFAEIRTDEVFDGRPLLLGECPRCEHRWTLAPLRRLSLPLVVAVRSPRPVRPAPEEPAAAA